MKEILSYQKSVLFWSEGCSVVSDSLQPRGLYSPWNSLGQNTGVDSLSLLQRIFPTQELNCGLLRCRQILYQLSYQGSSCLNMNSEPRTATPPLHQTSEESFQNRRQIKTTKSKKGLGRNRWQFKKLKETLNKKKPVLLSSEIKRSSMTLEKNSNKTNH